jgi:ribosomal protein S18
MPEDRTEMSESIKTTKLEFFTHQKIDFQNVGKKDFPDIQKLKKFITSRVLLQNDKVSPLRRSKQQTKSWMYTRSEEHQKWETTSSLM